MIEEKGRSEGNDLEFFKYEREVFDDEGYILAKNVLMFDVSMSDRFTKECLKELDRKICKYESVSLYECFSSLGFVSVFFFR